MSRELLDEFRSLTHASARDRGRALPRLLSRFFARAGFDVKEHARVASPRDADVFVTHDDNYLLEAKWTSRRSDIGTIDGLRGRLRRCPPDVVGLVVSVSGFTLGAIEGVRSDRTRLILLLDGDDLEDLFAGRVSPAPLLRMRKRVLIRDAATVVGRQDTKMAGLDVDRSRLMRGATSLVDLSGRKQPWVAVEGPAGEVVFADSIPDVDWTTAQGLGVGLELRLPVATGGDLGTALGLLARAGWITGAGRFAIHQPDLGWHGIGAHGLIEALRRQPDRHRERDRLWHDEEHLVYFDHCPDGSGYYSITSRVWLHRERLVDAHLSVRLAGTPVDGTRMRLLLDSLGVDDLGFYRPLDARQPLESWHWRRGNLPLVAFAQVQEADDGDWVTGIVTSNPIAQEAVAADRSSDLPEVLGSVDRLVCSLGSWHLAASAVRRYSLVRVERVWMETAQVISVHADWETPGDQPLESSRVRLDGEGAA